LLPVLGVSATEINAQEHRVARVLAYVDETGIDGVSPLMVRVGVVVMTSA